MQIYDTKQRISRLRIAYLDEKSKTVKFHLRAVLPMKNCSCRMEPELLSGFQNTDGGKEQLFSNRTLGPRWLRGRVSALGPIDGGLDSAEDHHVYRTERRLLPRTRDQTGH
ncbi:hypothetical protein AVEN_244433-1 [Araneus ventricosus]|uniref:Uncharacterized protein n=1 Tax=Araneus ventricosus TaxID=182803 RepID=A0A4Y2QTV5_ARAVE|nr:hypothetical protein AVEN_244433-1 [Araneus ventricosus]